MRNVLRSQRKALRISQGRLARLAGVSRFKISLYELEDGDLTTDEQQLIRKALEAEAERLRHISVDFGQSTFVETNARGGQAPTIGSPRQVPA